MYSNKNGNKISYKKNRFTFKSNFYKLKKSDILQFKTLNQL